MADDLVERLRKRAEDERTIQRNNEAVAEALKPQMEAFERQDGSHNTFAVRLGLDHKKCAENDAKLAADWDEAAARITALQAQNRKLLAARAVALEEAAMEVDWLDPDIWDYSTGNPGRRGESSAGRAIRALATTDSTAALDRVIRAHVEKALGMAAAECIVTAEEADLMADKHGRQISERTLQAIKRITADDVLREMGGRGNG